MRTFIGYIKKEEYKEDVVYWVRIPFEGAIVNSEESVDDIESHVGKKVEVEVITWNYLEKGMGRYRVVGIKKYEK